MTDRAEPPRDVEEGGGFATAPAPPSAALQGDRRGPLLDPSRSSAARPPLRRAPASLTGYHDASPAEAADGGGGLGGEGTSEIAEGPVAAETSAVAAAACEEGTSPGRSQTSSTETACCEPPPCPSLPAFDQLIDNGRRCLEIRGGLFHQILGLLYAGKLAVNPDSLRQCDRLKAAVIVWLKAYSKGTQDNSCR